MSDDLRFPIGKFSSPPAITHILVQQWTQEIADAPAQLRASVKGLSALQLDTPYRPGGWTVRQVVHHLPDSHINSYVRFKLALTEDQPVIKPYMEERWAEVADTRLTPVEVSLDLLDALHQRWVILLRSLTPVELLRTFVHPDSGLQTLDKTIAVYAWHGRHHVAHITSLRKRMGW